MWLFVCDHAHQAVVCFFLSGADHARAPVNIVILEGVLACPVIHNRHCDAFEAVIGLICFKEEGGGLSLGFIQTK